MLDVEALRRSDERQQEHESQDHETEGGQRHVSLAAAVQDRRPRTFQDFLEDLAHFAPLR